MEKVVLLKQEAIALESALEMNGLDKANVVHWHAQNLWDGNRAPLNDLDLDTVCKALYVGYEIEEGPEEKIKAVYDANNHLPSLQFGIRYTLKTLNVQIKGINC
ncbi:hypothetical protein [Neobacillus sp. NPDC093127]|uniref:hypothetical protein n=1 Tax=Neobacillus sp. NPDC093127 TaxID=3364296 RepID=UPI0038064B2E